MQISSCSFMALVVFGLLGLLVAALLGGPPQGRANGLIVGIPLLLAYGLARMFGPRARRPSERSARGVVAFAIGTIGYLSAATLLVSWNDFARYRFEIDGIYWLLAALMAADWAAMTRTWLERRKP